MTPPTPLVFVHSVHFSYGRDKILCDVSFTANSGEILAITGANGSGKSTLIELIAGIIRPDHGHVECNASVAVVVQRPNIPPELPLKVADVVTIGTWRRRSSRMHRRQAVSQTLERVGLHGLERRLFSELSGGQRQRVLVAQGLVQATPVLLLDEPLAALDAESREQIHKVLRSEADQGKAIILVTHDQDSQKLADQTISLDEVRSNNSTIPVTGQLDDWHVQQFR